MIHEINITDFVMYVCRNNAFSFTTKTNLLTLFLAYRSYERKKWKVFHLLSILIINQSRKQRYFGINAKYKMRFCVLFCFDDFEEHNFPD